MGDIGRDKKGSLQTRHVRILTAYCRLAYMMLQLSIKYHENNPVKIWIY